jgi:hypothetical protein
VRLGRAWGRQARPEPPDAHPRRCDLRAWILTDDAAGTVTFRLGQADPDFLYKLALILAAPTPPGAPDHAIDRAPFLPGTGPYMISQAVAGVDRRIRLDGSVPLNFAAHSPEEEM